MEVPVYLTPAFQRVPPGNSITLTCSYPLLNETKFWVEWEYSNKSKSNKQPLNNDKRFHMTKERYQSTLKIKKTYVNDSRLYFCKVAGDIPKLWESTSNESEVVIGKCKQVSSLIDGRNRL